MFNSLRLSPFRHYPPEYSYMNRVTASYKVDAAAPRLFGRAPQRTAAGRADRTPSTSSPGGGGGEEGRPAPPVRLSDGYEGSRPERARGRRGESGSRGAGAGSGGGSARAGAAPPPPVRKPSWAAAFKAKRGDDFVVVGKADLEASKAAAKKQEEDGYAFWVQFDPELLAEEEDEDEEEEEAEEGGAVAAGAASSRARGKDGAAGGAEGSRNRSSAYYGSDDDDDDDDDGDSAAAALEANPDESDDQRELRLWYTTRRRLPAWRAGPLKPTVLKSGRRSLVTTEAVAAGQLLLVAAPLALLTCPAGSAPENEDLAAAMLSGPGLTARQHAALALLFDGDTSKPLPVPPTLDELDGGGNGGDDDEEGRARGASGRGGGGAGGSAPRAPRAPVGMERAALEQLVNFNCLGDETEDALAVSLTGGAAESSGYVGLWPAAALANHDCAPSALFYALRGGRRLVVRACSEEPVGGSEVTLNYIGSAAMAPLRVRRDELRSRYTFDCGCQRCKAEEQLLSSQPALAALMDDAYALCQASSPRLNAAIEAGDLAAVRREHAALETSRQAFEAALRGVPRLNAKVKRWLQASVYDLYDLISLAADELAEAAPDYEDVSAAGLGGAAGRPLQGDGRVEASSSEATPPRRGGGGGGAATIETESLAVCARLVAAVLPGSADDVYLAAELYGRALGKFGDRHEETKQAKALVARALRVRYGGSLSDSLLEQLLVAALAMDRGASDVMEEGKDESEDDDDEEEEEKEEEKEEEVRGRPRSRDSRLGANAAAVGGSGTGGSPARAPPAAPPGRGTHQRSNSSSSSSSSTAPRPAGRSLFSEMLDGGPL